MRRKDYKWLGFILAAAMCTSMLSGCGASGDNQSNADTPTTAVEQTEQAEVKEEAGSEEIAKEEPAEQEEEAKEETGSGAMTQEEFDALEVTTVIPSDESPTGYYVTFRYKDPDAARVRIYGEWAFSDIEHATAFTSLNATPEEWQDGYTVWQSNGWPTADMELNEETGVWSYTIPLPNGTWGYRFYVGGADGADVKDYTDAVLAYDPNNVPYLADYTETDLTNEQYMTSVYVPYDAEKQANTTCVEEQAPRNGENGTVFFETVTTEDGTETSYGVYLPYNFDASREEAYPILLFYHGGGGFEGSWFNNGLINILDNMIAEGRMEPTIVVTPNGEDFPDPDEGWDREANLDFALNNILPHMVEKYNASEEPAKRALGGLSQGAANVMYGYFHCTDEFDYYISLSAPLRNNVYPEYTKEGLDDVRLFLAYGMYDSIVYGPIYKDTIAYGSCYDYIWGLSQAGVEFEVNTDLHYGHQWALWRELAVYSFDNILWKS